MESDRIEVIAVLAVDIFYLIGNLLNLRESLVGSFDSVGVEVRRGAVKGHDDVD